MSKGSKRRPLKASKVEFEENWERIFGDGVEMTFESEDDDIEFFSDEQIEAMIQKRFNVEH